MGVGRSRKRFPSYAMSGDNVTKDEKVLVEDILCDDLLTKILKLLSTEEKINCHGVSKQFKRCVDNIFAEYFGLRVGPIDQQLVCPDRRHSVHVLDVTKCTNIVDIREILPNQSQDLPNRTQVHFKSYDLSIQSFLKFESLLKFFSSNESLHLNRCLINSSVIKAIADNCPQLKCLTIADCTFYDSIDMFEENYSKMKSLDLKHLRLKNIRTIPLPFPSAVNRVNDFWLQLIVSSVYLRTLVIADHEMDIKDLFQRMSRSIKTLHLIKCSQLTAEAIDVLISANKTDLKEMYVEIGSIDMNAEELFHQLRQGLDLYVLKVTKGEKEYVYRFDSL